MCTHPHTTPHVHTHLQSLHAPTETPAYIHVPPHICTCLNTSTYLHTSTHAPHKPPKQPTGPASSRGSRGHWHHLCGAQHLEAVSGKWLVFFPSKGGAGAPTRGAAVLATQGSALHSPFNARPRASPGSRSPGDRCGQSSEGLVEWAVPAREKGVPRSRRCSRQEDTGWGVG